MSKAEVQSAISKYLEAYAKVAALQGTLASAESELRRRAKKLCEAMPLEALVYQSLAVNSPIGLISLTFDEEWQESANPVYLTFLKALDDVDFESLPKNQ